MIIRVKFYGSTFLGLYLLSAGNKIYYNKYIPKIAFAGKVESVPVHSDSRMLGMFFSGNKNGIVGAEPIENATVLDTKFNTFGNLILSNDKGAIISPFLTKSKKEIEKILGVPTEVSTIAGMNLVGSLGITNNHGCAVNKYATEEEMKKIEKTLKVDVEYGSLYQSGFLGAMAVVTDDTLITSPSILAPEIALLMQVLEIE